MSRYIFLFALITLSLVHAKQHHHHHHHHKTTSSSSSPLSYHDVAGTPYTVSYDHRAILINGQRTLMQSGSIHYPRSTPDMWPDILARVRASGLNVVQIYVFWNYHEPIRGQYDFITDSHNLPLFIQYVAEAGLFMNLRIGPYVCAEWTYGGLPIWLREDPNMVFRTDNAAWKQEMETFVNYVVKIVEPYLPRHGGPIILIQIENEYGNIESAYGSGATRYVAWAAALGNSYQLDVPWIMCQQNDAPNSVIATCNGYYCDNWLEDHFKNRPTQPGLWTENWPGWFQNWGEPVPHRPVEDVAFSVARWIARGGALFNYYMVHGGTSFGRSTGGPFIITSYDYDVMLNEYGLPSEPKYSHSSALHHILNTYATTILGQDKPVQQSLGWNTESHTYGTIGTSGSIAFLSNIGTTGGPSTVTFQNQTFSLPLWSVTIVDGATLNVLYCTATISPQHHAIAQSHHKRASERHTRKHTHATSITTWSEPTNAWNVPIIASSPLEQISVTKDTSDYLWYQTTVALTQADIDAGSVTLSLTNAYDYVSIFFNNNLIGTGRSIVFATSFQVNVSSMNPGNYPLSIACQTVGLVNYGVFLERYTRGLLGAITWNQQDITKSTWLHVTGLRGESLNVYTEVGSHAVTWTPYTSPQPWTWYKLELALPTPHASKDPAVWALDMHGMGKGAVWVNGHMLGRYWSILATGNCDPCSYVGKYDNPKCRTGCGDYSQRYYHVPKAWLNQNGPNLVVAWEEQIKANPNTIAFVQMN